MEHQINVIIPAAYKDYRFLKKTIKYVELNILPHQVILIIDTRLIGFLPKSVLSNPKVIVADENKILDGVTYKNVKNMLRTHGVPTSKTGWYLQQFIKLGFAKSKFSTTDYYLSWDADTLPLKKVTFFDAEAHPLFTKKAEHNEAYFQTLSKLIHLEKIANFSFIAEQMLFKKQIVDEMLIEIEKSSIKGYKWYEKIINATGCTDINSFSEFETYGNFCFNRYPNLYHVRTLNTFRKAGYIAGRFISDRKLKYMSFDLDIASFELGDYPCGINKIFSYLYSKYINLSQLIINCVYRKER